ncbi:MAG: cellobiose phosphorylase [Candidatus Omnitrophica bacterium]|nr:cellobiose phosphorylase [Candidatus Omnitrophota bacterium]MDD5352004.1 cellobiose phosphorylase [Candidatus Omnitrophota bacterium]MDD5551058.1 cellobiose phosphorylase [Candidatus Omnitrophota bacterium]
MNTNSFWKFTDNCGTFIAKDTQKISCLYFPLANETPVMSSVTPQLKGDIKTDNNSFLMLPLSRSDLADKNSARDFWIYLNKNKKAWPLAGNGTTNSKDKITLEAGHLYHKLTRKNASLGLEAEITNFIPVTQDAAELELIKITNISGSNLEITPTSAIPLFCRSADNLRDHRHVTSLLHRIKQDKYGVVVKPVMSFDERGHRINHTSYYVFGIDNNNQPPAGTFPTQESFTGEGANPQKPLAVLENLSPRKLSTEELSGKEAMAALRFKTKTLKPGQCLYFGLILGIAQAESDIYKTLKKFNTIVKIKTALEENKIYWKNKINNLSFNTGDYNYDNWLRWVNLQPALRKIYGCSFLPDFDYGRGGKGWRDLWQDCLALSLTQPKDIDYLLRSNFSGVRIDATNATIVTKKPGCFISDRNKIPRVWMDHGLWPFFTLELYINQTANLNILLEKTAYFRDSQIMRAREIDFNYSGDNHLKTKQNKIYTGTILEHILIQHLVQFFNVGPHNSIRLENADWNDGLDMAAQKGESVAFSAFYAHNFSKIADLLEKLKQTKKIKHICLLKEIIILLDTLNNPANYNSVRAKTKLLDKYLNATRLSVSGKTVKIAIEEVIKDLRRKADWLSKHIQDKEWIDISRDTGFFNGYYDNKSRRVEGKFNNQVRMTLTGQVFAILSGIATEKQIRKIYKAATLYLQDKKLKGFRLNTDFKTPQLDLGRAFSFAYGEKENGAIFSHMCVMFSYALYSRGFAKEGYEVLNSLYELAANSNASKIYPNLPEYFNLNGHGMYSYLTGSASWFILTLLTQAFGVNAELGDLVISPKLTKEQFKKSKEVCVQFNFLDKRVKISYFNPRKKDYAAYSIKQVKANVAFQKISGREIRVKRSALQSFRFNQININIILG